MSKSKWLAEEIAFVRQRYEAGDTDSTIGLAINRTAGAVSNLRQAHSIVRPADKLKRAPNWSEADLALATEMYARGDSNSTIAAATGRSRIATKRLVTERQLLRDRTASPNPKQYDTPQEVWKAAPCELPYAVSSAGRVLSLVPGRQGEILAQWVDRNGYAHVQLQVDGKSKRYAVHRLVALVFRGDPPTPTHQAAHNDGQPSNNRETNIRWATPAENQADRLQHGTAERGPRGQFIRGTADMVRQAEAAGIPVVHVPPSATSGGR